MREQWRFATFGYAGLAVIWCVYAYINLLEAGGMTLWRGSELTSDLVRLSVIIPVYIIWLVAFRGAVRFKNYALSIHSSPDGRSLNLVANGLLWLVVYIVLIPVLSALVRLWADTPWLGVGLFLRNHVPVAVVVVSQVLVFRGSRHLLAMVGGRLWTWRRWLFGFLPFCLWAAWFALTFHAQPPVADSSGLPRYAVPVDVLLFSYVLPHLVAWFLGVFASFNIAVYARKTTGSLYKVAFRNLAWGVFVVLVALMMVQVFGALAVTLLRLPPTSLLLLVYLLLAVAGAGFALVYRGAIRLGRLEG